MIDIHILRDKPEILENALKKRNADDELLAQLKRIKKEDVKWRKIKKEEEEHRAERNKLNNEIINLKKARKDAKKQIKKCPSLSSKIKELTEKRDGLEQKIKNELLFVPNIPDDSVPVGKDENDNVEIRKWGKNPKGAGDVISHYDLAKRTDNIDFERGVKLSGHRFSVLKGPIAKLERALVNFMLSVNESAGYNEVWVPYLVNTKTITGTGQLPKFAEDLYKCEAEDLWLIPTAEVPLTNLYAGEVLEEKDLPIKLMAFTPCFRREAGEYGKDIRGLIRQHQFDKVELVKFAHPERSFKELEGMVKDAEKVLKLLELPYRIAELCTGDLGFASAKTYDLELWIPSQDRYREVSSCSNCTDFQARRAGIKYRAATGKPEYVHTLNGSALAVGRTLIAILENHQEDKKTVVVPKALRNFFGSDSFELY